MPTSGIVRQVKPLTYSTSVFTSGEFAGKTLAPGYSNSLRDDEVARWKVAMGFDDASNPAPPPPRAYKCGDCDSTPCRCTEVPHSNDESGTYLTPSGKLILLNEGGCNSTTIDVRELVAWLRANRPELLHG
jgi:hypothetical protein